MSNSADLANTSSLAVTAEHRVLNALIPRVTAVTLLVLVVGAPATDKDLNGTFNKPIYAAILLLATAVTLLFVRRSRPTGLDVAIAFLSGGGLIWGMWVIERPRLLNYWEGFGYHVALASLVLLLVMAIILPLHRLPTAVRLALSLLVVAVCVFDILGGIRTLDYMVYVNNNLNEVNDILGPMAGKIPESTFIPQYTALYGWLFAPLKGVLSPLAIVGAIAIFLTVLGFITVGLAVLLVKRVLPGRGWMLALALVVPITYVTSHATGDINSIASLFQALPIRLFSGFLIVAIGLQDLLLMYRGTLRSWRLLAVGALCGLLAWNSQDFGVAAVGVYGLMVLVLPMPWDTVAGARGLGCGPGRRTGVVSALPRGHRPSAGPGVRRRLREALWRGIGISIHTGARPGCRRGAHDCQRDCRRLGTDHRAPARSSTR